MSDLAAEAKAVAGDVYLYDEEDWWDERERVQGLLRALAARIEELEADARVADERRDLDAD